MSSLLHEDGSGGSKPRARASKSKKDKNKDKSKVGGFHSCPGYYDEYGIWQNGFDCPRWGGITDKYCCGTQHEMTCCPEPDPEEPVETSHHSIPLIAGAAAGVVLIAVILICCFACRCCPGGKFLHRTKKRKPKKEEETKVHSHVCEHCNATLSSTSPDSLACGCPIGAPPGTHMHGDHGMGGSHIENDDFQQDVDMVLTLYENPAAHMYTDNEQVNKEMPCDEPPPYSENILMSKHDDSEVVNISPTAEEMPMIHRLPPPQSLCMKTFRPLDDPSPLNPFSPAILRNARSDYHHSILMDQSRRDSGVLVEDQEQNNSQAPENEDNEQEEQDNYNESIVVPKFNFQSLNLVNKSSGLHHHLSGSSSSGGLSQSRTTIGLTNSRSRSRIQSRSSVESMELEQLIESMNMHNNVPPV